MLEANETVWDKVLPPEVEELLAIGAPISTMKPITSSKHSSFSSSSSSKNDKKGKNGKKTPTVRIFLECSFLGRRANRESRTFYRTSTSCTNQVFTCETSGGDVQCAQEPCSSSV